MPLTHIEHLSPACSRSLKQAIALINTGIPEGKLPKLLQKILEKLHLPDVKPFSSEEEETLSEAFEVEHAVLTTMLDTISFLLETIAYVFFVNHRSREPLNLRFGPSFAVQIQATWTQRRCRRDAKSWLRRKSGDCAAKRPAPGVMLRPPLTAAV